jgi:hypothetical protein
MRHFRFTVTAGGASTRSTAWAGQTGTQTVATTQTITFASEAHMESLFNSGGLINIYICTLRWYIKR